MNCVWLFDLGLFWGWGKIGWFTALKYILIAISGTVLAIEFFKLFSGGTNVEEHHDIDGQPVRPSIEKVEDERGAKRDEEESRRTHCNFDDFMCLDEEEESGRKRRRLNRIVERVMKRLPRKPGEVFLRSVAETMMRGLCADQFGSLEYASHPIRGVCATGRKVPVDVSSLMQVLEEADMSSPHEKEEEAKWGNMYDDFDFLDDMNGLKPLERQAASYVAKK